MPACQFPFRKKNINAFLGLQGGKGMEDRCKTSIIPGISIDLSHGIETSIQITDYKTTEEPIPKE